MAATGQFAEHLAPGLREIIGTRLGGRRSYYSQLLRVETSDKAFEDYLAAAGLPIAVEKPQGEDVASYDPLEGEKMRVSHTVSAIGAEITEEMQDDDLYKGNGSALDTIGNGIADSLAEYVEIQAHRFFGSEAFLGSAVPTFLRTLPDAASTVSVFSLTHGRVAGGEAPTQANRPSVDVDLTVTSYRAGLTQFRKYVNDRNLRVPEIAFPDRLVVGADQEWDALEIIKSINRPDTMNRVENVTKDMTSVIVDPYITDPDAWFLLSPKHWLIWLWRKRPYMDAFDDRRARVSCFIGLQRAGKAAAHWIGTYGSPGG
jgi:hypothetical protein